MKKNHVLIVGGTSLDTIIQLYSPLKQGPQTTWAKSCYKAVGGTGAGKALNLSRLGFEVSLHTCLGDDVEAQAVIDGLTHDNIQLLIEYGSQPTEQHTNLMTPEGDRTSIYTHPPENPKEFDMSGVEEAMKRTDIAAISILDYTRPTLALAKQYDKPLWIDLHDYDGKNPYHQEFLDAADVVFLSSDKLPDYRSFMQQQIDDGKLLVVCTHGKQGATALDVTGKFYEQPIIEDYALLDSNGAGDAFFSGYLYAHMQEQSIPECMLAGAIVAGMCIESPLLFNESLHGELVDKAMQAVVRG